MPDQSQTCPSIYQEPSVATANTFDAQLDLSPTFAAHVQSRFAEHYAALEKRRQFEAKQERVKEKKRALALRSKLARMYQHGEEDVSNAASAATQPGSSAPEGSSLQIQAQAQPTSKPPSFAPEILDAARDTLNELSSSRLQDAAHGATPH